MANETDTNYEYTEAEEIQFLIGNTIIPAIAYTLALFPTIPIDVYIVYRLMFKKIKKTAYFCIIMLMCALDVYDCFFEAREFLGYYIVGVLATRLVICLGISSNFYGVW